MRVLVYGLQNSGATLVTLYIGQRSGTLVVPDLWTMFCAPRGPFEQDLCVKVTITESFPLETHVAAFEPDFKILVVRRPIDNWLSLRKKSFANHDGTIEQKFARADDVFLHRSDFDAFIVFEDFVSFPALLSESLRNAGWDLPADADCFPRSTLDMERYIWSTAPYLYRQIQWGVGQARIQALENISLGYSDDPQARAFCERHCPNLHRFYEEHPTSRVSGAVRPVTHVSQDEEALQSQLGFIGNMVGLFENALHVGGTSMAMEIAEDLCICAPNSPEGWNAKARVLEVMGDLPAAEKVLQEALLRAHTDRAPAFYLNLARQALRLGQINSGLEIAERILDEDPDNFPARITAAEAQVRACRFESAMNHAERVMALDPRSTNARRLMAESLVGLGRKQEAIDMFRSCLAISPGYRPAELRLLQLTGVLPS